MPRVSRPLLRWFTWYARRYVRRHCHAVRVSRRGPPPPTDEVPLVLYSNHPSWWDPLMGVVVKGEYFPERPAYAPMDASALARYRMFARLGFFGVARGSAAGARHFLRVAQAVLERPRSLLWMTPQGRFSDARERPLAFDAGLGFLAARVRRARFVPLATELVFWEERLPEMLVRFGAACEVCTGEPPARAPVEWTRVFEGHLADTMDALAREAIRREPADFDTVLRGGAGVGGVYDWWRKWRARWAGRGFDPGHGVK